MDKNFFIRPSRMVVQVPKNDLDSELVTVQGKGTTVRELYTDYVLGRLDASKIGSTPVYDPEGAEEVDPFNNFGITLEEATAIEDAGRSAANEYKQRRKSADHPRESSPEQANERNQEENAGQ